MLLRGKAWPGRCAPHKGLQSRSPRIRSPRNNRYPGRPHDLQYPGQVLKWFRWGSWRISPTAAVYCLIRARRRLGASVAYSGRGNMEAVSSGCSHERRDLVSSAASRMLLIEHGGLHWNGDDREANASHGVGPRRLLLNWSDWGEWFLHLEKISWLHSIVAGPVSIELLEAIWCRFYHWSLCV